MFTLTPKDLWFKIPRGGICYTCLKPKGPKGLYKNKRCSEEKGIPQVLLCAACTPWAAAKGWAPFNVLMCQCVKNLNMAKIRQNLPTLGNFFRNI